MNINKDRGELRKKRISAMQNSISKAIKPDLKMLVMLSCNKYGISIRTAKEYLKIALFNIENEESENVPHD